MKTKKFTFLLFILVFLIQLKAQEHKHFYAVVEKISGIPIFIFSTPISKYQVVGKAVTTGNAIKITLNEKATIREKNRKICRTSI